MTDPSGRLGTIDRFYTRWARGYDLLARHAPLVHRYRRRAVASLDLTDGDQAVELGCGTGANLPFLLDRVGPTGTVVGIDLARGALSRADEHSNAPSLHLVRGDVTAPPVRHADAILATFLVGMLDDPAVAIDTWLDRLTDGGHIALLHATASGRPGFAPLDRAFRTLVGLAAAGGPAGPSAVTRHETRVQRAHAAIAEQCVDVQRESLAGGYLMLVSGRKPPTPR